MVEWHHWFNGHEFEQTQEGDSDEQGSLCAAIHGVEKSWTRLKRLNKHIFVLSNVPALAYYCSQIFLSVSQWLMNISTHLCVFLFFSYIALILSYGKPIVKSHCQVYLQVLACKCKHMITDEWIKKTLSSSPIISVRIYEPS